MSGQSLENNHKNFEIPSHISERLLIRIKARIEQSEKYNSLNAWHNASIEVSAFIQVFRSTPLERYLNEQLLYIGKKISQLSFSGELSK